jgi:hypothetical protein
MTDRIDPVGLGQPAENARYLNPFNVTSVRRSSARWPQQ